METKMESGRGHRSAGTIVTEVRIVESAAQLFAHNGSKGTTTRDIAQLADLNEATLFRYFPRTPELFWAAVKSHIARMKRRAPRLVERALRYQPRGMADNGHPTHISQRARDMGHPVSMIHPTL